MSVSYEIIEVALGAKVASQPENGRGHNRRIELNVIAGALPEIAFVRQQVVDLKDAGRLDAQFLQGQRQPSVLDVLWVKVHDRENQVVAILRRLAVGNELLVVHGGRRAGRCFAGPDSRGGCG